MCGVIYHINVGPSVLIRPRDIVAQADSESAMGYTRLMQVVRDETAEGRTAV